MVFSCNVTEKNEALGRLLVADQKTETLFQIEVVERLERWCIEFSGRYTACVLELPNEDLIFGVGVESLLHDEVLSDSLSDLELELSEKGWKRFSVHEVPVNILEKDPSGFSSFAHRYTRGNE